MLLSIWEMIDMPFSIRGRLYAARTCSSSAFVHFKPLYLRRVIDFYRVLLYIYNFYLFIIISLLISKDGMIRHCDRVASIPAFLMLL